MTEGNCVKAVRALTEWLGKRAELWEKFAEAARRCRWLDDLEACREARRLARELGLNDGELLDDPYHDHECAFRLAEELKRILKVIGCGRG